MAQGRPKAEVRACDRRQDRQDAARPLADGPAAPTDGAMRARVADESSQLLHLIRGGARTLETGSDLIDRKHHRDDNRGERGAN